MIKKYKSKPRTIEAIEYTGENHSDIEHFIGHALIRPNYTGGLQIPTLEGVLIAFKGYFIVKGVEGEFYPVKSDLFHRCYKELKVLITP